MNQQDVGDRELQLTSMIAALKSALAPLDDQHWNRENFAVRDDTGETVCWHVPSAQGNARLDWIATANPRAIGLLLDELVRLRGGTAEPLR